MIESMTGYGKARIEGEYIASVEIKSLNSKFLDLGVRLPRFFSDKEMEVRSLISNILERGKINVMIEFESNEDATSRMLVNRTLASAYYQELKEMANELGADHKDLLRLTLQIPEVMKTENDQEQLNQYWVGLKKLIEQAARDCKEFRKKEGEKLYSFLKEYIERIKKLRVEVVSLDPERIEHIRTRIKDNLAEFVAEEEIDQNRFEQELIYYIEKLDINEELDRLETHLNHFEEVLDSKEANGKKLGFISQEIGREINTIGSKANDSNIQIKVINMKEELEKIKEQVLNIL